MARDVRHSDAGNERRSHPGDPRSSWGMKIGFVSTRFAGTDGVSLESMKWAEVPCKIDSAVVRLDPKTKAAAYLPDVRYRYQWNDRTYHGTRFAWDTSSYSRKSSIEKWIEPFPAGKETVCFVNPNQPEEAVLLRSFPKPTLLVNTVIFFLIAVGFEVMGTLLIGLLPPWKKP